MHLNQSRFNQAEYVRNIWAVTPEAGTKVEDMLDPAFWSHVAASLKPWDKIEVRAEDGTFYAELLVLQSARNWAKVRLLSRVELKDAMPEGREVDGHIIKWAGPHAKWRVIRSTDNAVIHEKAESEAAANKWLTDHLRVTA